MTLVRKLLSAALAALMLLCGAVRADTPRDNAQLVPDSPLQQVAVDALAEVTAAEPYMRGAVVVTDMQGRVLALADNLPDGAPMALTARATPGRTLLPLTALTALARGAVSPEERISDQGAFDLYDKIDPLRCWIGPEHINRHANQTLIDALRNGCDYYFYTAASRTGVDPWVMLAQALGLDRPSGLGMPGEQVSLLASPKNLYDPELPVEAQPTVYPARVRASLVQHLRLMGQGSGLNPTDEALNACADALMRMAVDTSQVDWVKNIREVVARELAFSESVLYTQACIGPIYLWLNEIKWGGTQTIAAAVGNSFTQVTPVAMARCWTAIANGGTVYDLQLAQADEAPQAALDLTDIIGPHLPIVQTGLHGVLDTTGAAAPAFIHNPHRDRIACILAVGESSEPGVGLSTWAVGFAPHENPQITVVVLLLGDPNTRHAANIFCRVIDAYLR